MRGCGTPRRLQSPRQPPLFLIASLLVHEPTTNWGTERTVMFILARERSRLRCKTKLVGPDYPVYLVFLAGWTGKLHHKDQMNQIDQIDRTDQNNR